MRRNTQSTITDRILGICRDRQAVSAEGRTRRVTVLLGLWRKRPSHHQRHPYQSPTSFLMSCLGVGSLVTGMVRNWEHWGDEMAFCCPAWVEVSASEGR
jgi:hypothetical protein